jgi:hypothetical protein
MTRDLLEAAPVSPSTGSQSELMELMAQQNDLLANIAMYLRQQNPDILTSTIVHGTSQGYNNIIDLAPHMVHFEVGGKPVQVYQIFAFSSYSEVVTLSIQNMGSAMDGLRFSAGDMMVFPISIENVYIQAEALAASNSLIVNGPADATEGGFFCFGFTIPDYDRIRGSRRSG